MSSRLKIRKFDFARAYKIVILISADVVVRAVTRIDIVSHRFNGYAVKSSWLLEL